MRVALDDIPSLLTLFLFGPNPDGEGSAPTAVNDDNKETPP
jgi:hypothetical protein